MRRWCKVFVTACLTMVTGFAAAGMIVSGLDDASALAQYTAARNGALNEVADNTTGLLTLAARFNPDASQSAAGPVVVIEIGGTSNGTGLYLANGSLVFVSKAVNGRYSLPTSLNDTDFVNDGSGKALAVSLGAVNFGTENNVYASMDLKTGKLFASVNGAASFYTILNSTGAENLDGNRSISFLGTGAPLDFGSLGGLVEEGNGNNAAALYPQLFWTNAVAMVQTDGYGNQLGQVFAAYIPEPATMCLLALGAAALRRRK